MESPAKKLRAAKKLRVLPICSEDCLEMAKGLPTTAKDIFVVSYPKSGTTWTQNIVYQLVTAGARELSHISDYAPFFDVDRTWDPATKLPRDPAASNHAVIGRRIFNTHFWPDMLPAGPARFVYLVRDGRDVVTSMFHHFTHQPVADGGFEGTFDEFFTAWINGDVAYGKWADNVELWTAAARTDPRVLLLRYEDMKTDIRGCVQKIIDHCDLPISDDKLTELLPKFSFQYMKTNLAKFSPKTTELRESADGFQFVRKGKVGDHIALFNPEHHAQYAHMVKTRFPEGLDVTLRGASDR